MLVIRFGCKVVKIEHNVLRVIYEHHHSAKIGGIRMYNASYQKIART